ncbi:hypothetical protein VTH8203_01527 [Vibrio thalassae]|uniref:Lipoprotein n=1 Tax=Vibrio thalassae TaxID=1243014 RepID=A0A240EGX4_9VIBR|nr:hypothetical protein [Vibrio thalassae]SNX47912.1 hypothetical protein VTH8203_01527 [Vibrio thalassae]
MFKNLPVVIAAAFTLTGCLTTSLEQLEQRKLTYETWDVRKDKTTPGAIIVRESDLIFKYVTPEQEAKFQYDLSKAPYAKNVVKGVITNTTSDYGNTFSLYSVPATDWIPEYQRISKYGNQDRILVDAGSTLVHAVCTQTKSRLVGDIRSEQTSAINVTLEPKKCYQVITKLDNPRMGYTLRNSLGTDAKRSHLNEINWWEQCHHETVVEEIDCRSIGETRFN